jgi:hypothetical protein
MTAGAIPLFSARHAAGKNIAMKTENRFLITIYDDPLFGEPEGLGGVKGK